MFPSCSRLALIPNLDELLAAYARLALDDAKALVILAEVP